MGYSFKKLCAFAPLREENFGNAFLRQHDNDGFKSLRLGALSEAGVRKTLGFTQRRKDAKKKMDENEINYKLRFRAYP